MLISNPLKKVAKKTQANKDIWYPYRIKKLLLFALFANFKTKNGRNGSKRRKTYFINMSIQSNFTATSGRLHFVKKGQNCCTLMNKYAGIKFANVSSQWKVWTLLTNRKQEVLTHNMPIAWSRGVEIALIARNIEF